MASIPRIGGPQKNLEKKYRLDDPRLLFVTVPDEHLRPLVLCVYTENLEKQVPSRVLADPDLCRGPDILINPEFVLIDPDDQGISGLVQFKNLTLVVSEVLAVDPPVVLSDHQALLHTVSSPRKQRTVIRRPFERDIHLPDDDFTHQIGVGGLGAETDGPGMGLVELVEVGQIGPSPRLVECF